MIGGMLFLWAALIALVVWGAGKVLPERGRASPVRVAPNPLEILAQRCARGEIDRDTYERMRQDIA